jgi:lysophospholipase L1-like esterase
MRSFKTYSMLLIAGAIAPLLAVIMAATWSYFEYPSRMDRVANVVSVPLRYRLPLILDFVEAKLDAAHGKVTVILGDSQFYGYNQSWNDTFPAFLAKMNPDRKIINISVVAGRFNDTLLVLSHIKDPRIGTILYEVNPSQFSTNIDPDDQQLAANTSRYPFFLLVPSIAWKFERSFIRHSGRQTFQYLQLEAKRYIIPRKSRNIEKYRQVLSVLQNSGKRVIVVMSPQDLAAFPLYRYDVAQIRRDSGYLMGICREYRVTCVDMLDKLDNSDFFDVVHLNTRGHEKVAQLLMPYLR